MLDLKRIQENKEHIISYVRMLVLLVHYTVWLTIQQVRVEQNQK